MVERRPATAAGCLADGELSASTTRTPGTSDAVVGRNPVVSRSSALVVLQTTAPRPALLGAENRLLPLVTPGFRGFLATIGARVADSRAV